MDVSAITATKQEYVRQSVSLAVMKDAMQISSAAAMALVSDLAEATEALEAAVAAVSGGNVDISV